MNRPKRSRLATEALSLFAELTDPANDWCSEGDSLATLVYQVILSRMYVDDRDRAGRLIASAIEHATDADLQDIIDALRKDRACMRESHAEEHKARLAEWRAAKPRRAS